MINIILSLRSGILHFLIELRRRVFCLIIQEKLCALGCSGCIDDIVYSTIRLGKKLLKKCLDGQSESDITIALVCVLIKTIEIQCHESSYMR